MDFLKKFSATAPPPFSLERRPSRIDPCAVR
jgi:hypothetical protein